MALRIALAFLVIIADNSESLVNLKYTLNISNIGIIPFGLAESLIALIAIYRIASALVLVPWSSLEIILYIYYNKI